MQCKELRWHGCKRGLSVAGDIENSNSDVLSSRTWRVDYLSLYSLSRGSEKKTQCPTCAPLPRPAVTDLYSFCWDLFRVHLKLGNGGASPAEQWFRLSAVVVNIFGCDCRSTEYRWCNGSFMTLSFVGRSDLKHLHKQGLLGICK